MPFTRDLRDGPRNHYVDLLAFQFRAVGDTLRSLDSELTGRSLLTTVDLAEVRVRLSMAHAALDRIEIEVEHSIPALLAHGASNDFMGAHDGAAS